jgi:hypothetical protein
MIELSQREAESFLVLYHLRYLTQEQLGRIWYSERSSGACDRRLRRLREKGLLNRVHIGHPKWTSAWTLTGEGIRTLRGLRDGEFHSSRPVSSMFLPHLLQTNEVFLKLSGGEWLWDRLPFRWRGSHRASFEYQDNSDGGRNARLTADAVITPRGHGPRVLLELDRSSERIRKQDRGRTIEGKLTAYKLFLTGRPLSGLTVNQTWYAKAFGDEKPARVIFALGKESDSKILKRNLQRRAAKILEMAADICPEIDVCSMTLEEISGGKEIFGQDLNVVGESEMLGDDVTDLTPDDYVALRKLLQSAHTIYPTVKDPKLRLMLRESANGAREVLKKLLPLGARQDWASAENS